MRPWGLEPIVIVRQLEEHGRYEVDVRVEYGKATKLIRLFFIAMCLLGILYLLLFSGLLIIEALANQGVFRDLFWNGRYHMMAMGTLIVGAFPILVLDSLSGVLERRLWTLLTKSATES